MRQKSLFLWPGTKVYKLWVSKTGLQNLPNKIYWNQLNQLFYFFLSSQNVASLLDRTGRFFLIIDFQKMTPVCILTEVVVTEWALADSRANPFVLAFSVISESHCRLSSSGWLIIKTAKMNSSIISQPDFSATYWPSPSYICYSICKAVAVIKHLLGTCYRQGLYENPLKLETNWTWPVWALKILLNGEREVVY